MAAIKAVAMVAMGAMVAMVAMVILAAVLEDVLPVSVVGSKAPLFTYAVPRPPSQGKYQPLATPLREYKDTGFVDAQVLL